MTIPTRGDGTVHLLHNNDSLFSGKFDAEILQMKLNPGDAYWVRTRGSKVPFLNLYPNIVDFKPLDEKNCPGLTEFLKGE